MDRIKAIKVLDMFLHKQCDLARTSCSYDYDTVWEAVHFAREDMKTLGSVNVVRVVHAHWVCESKGDRYSDYHCSNCGNQLKFAYTNIEKEQAEKRHLYCDCCGAKMDEVKNDERY